MGETMRRFRWFWAWQENRETAWLEEMSRTGWHLEAYAFGFYGFRRGEPVDFLYRLDFDPGASKRWGEYLGIFEEAGWEHVLRWGSWQYFRAERGTTLSEEIYTDRDSRIAKYQRLLAIVAVTMILPAASMWLLLRRTYDGLGWLYDAMQILRFLLLGIGIFAAIRLVALINRLRK